MLWSSQCFYAKLQRGGAFEDSERQAGVQHEQAVASVAAEGAAIMQAVDSAYFVRFAVTTREPLLLTLQSRWRALKTAVQHRRLAS